MLTRLTDFVGSNECTGQPQSGPATLDNDIHDRRCTVVVEVSPTQVSDISLVYRPVFYFSVLQILTVHVYAIYWHYAPLLADRGHTHQLIACMQESMCLVVVTT